MILFFFDGTGMIYMHWVPIGQTINEEYYVEVLREVRLWFRRKRLLLFKSGQWHFQSDNAPVHNSILVTDFWLFPKLKERIIGCCYETTEEMKEAVAKVIDTLTQEDFHGVFQNLLERYNKCIAAGGDYFEGD